MSVATIILVCFLFQYFRPSSPLEVEAALRLAEKQKEREEADAARLKAEAAYLEAKHQSLVRGFVESAFLRQERSRK